MISVIDHINLVVSDLERSVEFYTQVLGFKETKRATLTGKWIEAVVNLENVEADVVYLSAPAGGPRIELLCYKSPKGQSIAENSVPNTKGLRHIAFQVKNLDDFDQKLRNAGVSTFGPPVKVPGSAVKHDDGEKSLLYFLDPDGIILELAEYS